MNSDIGDVLVVVGLGLLLWGLWLFDYRLAIVGAGIFLLLSGIVRLWYNLLKR